MLLKTLAVSAYDTSLSPATLLTTASTLRWSTVYASSQSLIYFVPVVLKSSSTIDILNKKHSEAFLTMLASENLLKEEWEQPEEDTAWKDL